MAKWAISTKVESSTLKTVLKLPPILKTSWSSMALESICGMSHKQELLSVSIRYYLLYCRELGTGTKKVERESSSMLMALFMMALFMKNTIMEVARSHGLLGINMKATGKEVKWMVQVYLSIRQVFYLREFSRTITSSTRASLGIPS